MQQIAKVSVEARSGTARFRVGVQAGSNRKALDLVGGRYPQGEVRVAFPIEQEVFSPPSHRPRRGWSVPYEPSQRPPEGLRERRSGEYTRASGLARSGWKTAK